MKMSKRRLLLGFAAMAALVPVAAGAVPPASMPILDATRIAAAGGALARTLGMSVISTCAQNYSVYNPKTAASAYGQPTQSIQGITHISQEISPVSVPFIQVVHANYWSSSSLAADVAFGEGPPQGMASISGYTADLAGNSFDLLWGGSKFKEFGYGAVKSDFCPLPVVAGQWYGVATCMMPSKMSQQFQARTGLGALAGGVSLFTHSGSWADDVTSGFLTGSGFPAPTAGGYAHGLVLGYTGDKPTKTIIIIGDSNQQALGENVLGNSVTRFGLDNFNLSLTEANQGTPAFAVTNLSKQGESLRGFSQATQHQLRLYLASFHTNAFLMLQANDAIFGNSLATRKAAILKICKLYTTMGLRLFVFTCPPLTNSTDGWVTAGGQTPATTEADRTGTNDWILDASANGMAAQGLADGCKTAPIPVDYCSFCEVNASNVLTRNGGRMIAPTGSAGYTGTVTTIGTSSFTDTALAASVNAYRGYVLKWKTGASANKCAVIGGNTASVLSYNTSFAGMIVGDQYELWPLDQPRLMDLAHETPSFHIAAAQFIKTYVKPLLV